VTSYITAVIRLLTWYPLRRLLALAPPPRVWALLLSKGPVIARLFRQRVADLADTARYLGLENPDDLAARALVMHLLNELDIFYFNRPGRLLPYLRVHGAEHIQSRKPLIVLFSHFGPNTLFLPILAKQPGYAQIGLAPSELIKENKVTSLSQKKVLQTKDALLRALGIPFLSSQAGLRKAVKHLRSGGIVGVAGDGRFGRHFIPVPFLDTQAFFSPGPFKLAFLTKASLVPAFAYRRKDRVDLLFEPPLSAGEPATGKRAFTGAMLSRYARRLEAHVRQAPALYLYYVLLTRRHTTEVNRFID